MINGLKCKKAQIIIGDIKTTAWFCTDLPFTEGQFYYYGLPGLIIKMKNSLGWEAEFLEIIYNKNPKKLIDVYPYRLVTAAQFTKAKRNKVQALEDGRSPNGSFTIEKSEN